MSSRVGLKPHPISVSVTQYFLLIAQRTLSTCKDFTFNSKCLQYLSFARLFSEMLRLIVV
jgi:hypothetical protein